jgi:hypothetical protein
VFLSRLFVQYLLLKKIIIFRNLVKNIYFLSVLFITGCNQNDEVAMLYSYPKYGHCSIESPARGDTLTIGKELLISGWAYDENKKTIPSTLTMYFINENTNRITAATVKRGEKREDVAKVLENPILVDSGFSGSIEAKKLVAGKYRLILLQADRTSGVISCAGESHTVILQ